jgi:hypothetical protein
MNKQAHKLSAGLYTMGLYQIERSGVVWKVHHVDPYADRKDWCIDCATLADAKAWIKRTEGWL